MQQAPEWHREEITVNGQSLSVARCGQGPALLLVHGFTDSAACWASLALALQSDYRLIAYDARGHGLSNRLQGPFSVKDLAEDLIGVVESLGLESAIWVGHSLGAATVAYAAALRPNLPRAIILEDPPYYAQAGKPEETHQQMQAWRADLAMLREQPTEAMALIYREKSYPGWQDVDIMPRAEARSQLDLNIFELLDWHRDSDWRATLPQIQAPSLLLSGDPQLGGIITAQIAQEMQRLLPGLNWQHTDGVGHHIRCAALEQTVATLRHFIETADLGTAESHG